MSEKPIIARWRARVGLRDVLAQLVVALVLFLAIYWLVNNVVSNLERQNIASGFGFFNERAGFGINQTLIEYDEDNSYGRVLVVGLLNTLLVSVLGIAAASFLGFFIGIGRLSQNWLISKWRWSISKYSETCRFYCKSCSGISACYAICPCRDNRSVWASLYF